MHCAQGILRSQAAFRRRHSVHTTGGRRRFRLGVGPRSLLVDILGHSTVYDDTANNKSVHVQWYDPFRAEETPIGLNGDSNFPFGSSRRS